MRFNIHKIVNDSLIYGPYRRTIIWFKGCTLHCKNCINKELWSSKPEQLMDVKSILYQVKNDHVTFLGGEPLQQKELVKLIIALKDKNIGIVLFTGYSIKEFDDEKRHATSLCDVVVSGRYIDELKDDSCYLKGSSNQIISFNSNRYNKTLFKKPNSIELISKKYGVEFRGRDKKIINKLLEMH
jgi:anaerobic ribonucleoside-triphosphate reductase activating protein